MEKRTKTRNQIKREMIENAALAAVAIVLCGLLTVWAVGVWAEHPGEQPISGSEYIASFGE